MHLWVLLCLRSPSATLFVPVFICSKKEGEVLLQRAEPFPAVNGVYLYVSVLDLYEVGITDCYYNK